MISHAFSCSLTTCNFSLSLSVFLQPFSKCNKFQANTGAFAAFRSLSLCLPLFLPPLSPSLSHIHTLFSLPLSRRHRWQCETLSNLINSLRTETFARFVPFSNLPENSTRAHTHALHTHTQTGTHTGTYTVRHTEKVLYLRILSSIS